MNKEELIKNLKYTEKKHRNDTVNTFDTDISTMCADVLRVLENCIEIPYGMTNGDMIKAMFPNAKTWEVTRDDIHCAFIDFKDICEIKSFPLSWWNAPYKKEVEE